METGREPLSMPHVKAIFVILPLLCYLGNSFQNMIKSPLTNNKLTCIRVQAEHDDMHDNIFYIQPFNTKLIPLDNPSTKLTLTDEVTRQHLMRVTLKLPSFIWLLGSLT